MSEPSNVVNMKVQGRLIREAREARAKRKAERCNYPTAAADTWNPEVKFPGGIEDLVRAAGEYRPSTLEEIARVEKVISLSRLPGGIDDMEI